MKLTWITIVDPMHLALIAAVLISCSISSIASNGSPQSEYPYKRNATREEHLSEMYFQNQLRERTLGPHNDPYSLIGANYPCLYGVTPIGHDSPLSAWDGHKFACGIHHIKSRPIVYSFGSNMQQDFEKSILFYRPDALVYTFEIKANKLPTQRDPNIIYTVVGLGPTSDAPLKMGSTEPPDRMILLHQIMKMLNHTYVDVLKIDIEGGEHPWVKAEPIETFTRVGQLLIEVHNYIEGIIFHQ